MTRDEATFLTRVAIRNYKSVRACSVNLGPLTFLVGPNGAGKSNFLDALRFVADALDTTLDHAIRERGGINEVRRRSGGHPTHFGLRLEFRFPSGASGHYAFRVGAQPEGAFEVQEEQCVVGEVMSYPQMFHVRSGVVGESTIKAPPPASRDRLYLVTASGLPAFRGLFDALSKMGFYNLNPGEIRDLQPAQVGEILVRDGRNLASVLGELAVHDLLAKRRVEQYLAEVVPGIRGVDRKAFGPRQTIEFRQQVAGSKDPWRFTAASMSDGTLRALGVLVALFQGRNGERRRVSLVGIEEPEAALHPAAAGVLLDALREASKRVQVIVTSHSPDLLDSPEIETDWLLAVTADGDVTTIGPIDQRGREALRERLFTPGELLRLDRLAPDASLSHGEGQLQLFGSKRG
ncbi:MAG: AAA family ATPase [Actinomycetota bacterium]